MNGDELVATILIGGSLGFVAVVVLGVVVLVVLDWLGLIP